MCGRFANRVPKMPAWAELLKIWPDVNPSYNVSPTQTIAAFRSPAGKSMRWGLIPHWAKEFSSEYATFNARLESAPEKPAFRDAWEQSQRCLIPMFGYYEWQGPKGQKQPYFVQAADKSGLVMAGLYDSWGGAKHYSCTILTRPADDDIKFIHGRMPVMLTPDTAKEWMNLNASDAQDFLMQASKPELAYYPVTKNVGNVQSNGKRLTEEIQLKDASE